MSSNNIYEIYDALKRLSENKNNTFTKIHTLSKKGTNFVIFTYGIASYSDWLYPYSLESKGIMFEVDKNYNPIRIACRPMQKFFNLYENPFTEELLDCDIQHVFVKEDGSLISTFLDKGELFVKSKASLFSEQAEDAQQWLENPEQLSLYKTLKKYADLNYTVNMEWVSPKNRIVLSYKEAKLIILNVRHNVTGEYLPKENLLNDEVISQYLVKDSDDLYTTNLLLDKVKNMKNEEGFVIWKNNRPYCKIKCPWYINIHSVKSYLSSDKFLWEAVANGTTDDIKSLFATDVFALKRIEKFELKYKNLFSKIYENIISVYEELKDLNRKDYAIQAKSIFDKTTNPKLFGLAMQAYLKGVNDDLLTSIKEYLIKNRELYF